MAYEPIPATYTQRERFNQMRSMLEANEVPRPHILWLYGAALIAFLDSIGKQPFFRDGPILHDKLYRYNLDFGRFRQVEPREL